MKYFGALIKIKIHNQTKNQAYIIWTALKGRGGVQGLKNRCSQSPKIYFGFKIIEINTCLSAPFGGHFGKIFFEINHS